jgi:hypothetical protein
MPRKAEKFMNDDAVDRFGRLIELRESGLFGSPALVCDCGCCEFFKFGPYAEGEASEPGLRLIYTCTHCGEQLRIYQTGDKYREAKAIARRGQFLRPSEKLTSYVPGAGDE